MSKNTIYFDVQDSIASTELNEYDIEKIQYVRWKDSNNKTYNTHIIRHDLEGLANNTTYTSFSSGYYFLPQVMTVTQTTIAAGGAAYPGNKNCDFAASIKNSVLTAINQVTVKLNDFQYTDASQYACMFENWELLHLSPNDVKNMGDLINFYPDSSTSCVATVDTANAPDKFEFNNTIKQTAFDPSKGYEDIAYESVNEGRLKRMLDTSFNTDGTKITTFYLSGSLSDTQKSYVKNPEVSGGVNVIRYYIFSYIPLGFIHPIFKKLPVMRGMKLNLQVQINNGYEVELTIDPATSKYTASAVTSNSIGNNICPFQVSPVGAGVSTALGEKFKVNWDINTSLQVDIILPQITFTPDFESKYNSSPVKKISYLDYMVYSPSGISNIPQDGAVNQERIVNSVVRPRDLILIPQSEDSMKHPFSSAPLTTFPNAKLSNFNVQINGQNIWQESQLYTYQSYLEMVGSLTIDGRQHKHYGVSNGLISKSDWEKNYSYYYVNLNQAKNSPDDRLGKQISVSFTNKSKKQLKYYAIVTRERQLLVDVSVGKLRECTTEDDGVEIPKSIE
jgi:hypothetical protein